MAGSKENLKKAFRDPRDRLRFGFMSDDLLRNELIAALEVAENLVDYMSEEQLNAALMGQRQRTASEEAMKEAARRQREWARRFGWGGFGYDQGRPGGDETIFTFTPPGLGGGLNLDEVIRMAERIGMTAEAIDALRRSAYGHSKEEPEPSEPNLKSNKWYEVLGLTTHARSAEIKKAARPLMQKYHPDRAPQGKASEYTTIFKHIEWAKREGLDGCPVDREGRPL